ncbi:MAG TPA: MFS transporter [Burkholderiaceae bacterium]|jgi:predicted MFS family arabinose efflux permease
MTKLTSSADERMNLMRVMPLMPLMPLMAASFLQVVDMMLVNPLGAWIVPELGLGTTQFSLLLLAYNLVSAGVGLLSAPLLDGANRRLVLFASCLALSLVTLLTALASDLAEIALLRGFAGVFGGLIASQTLAMIGDLVAPAQRGRAIGFVMSAFGLASVAGVPLSLALAGLWGWRAAFVGVGSAGIVVAVFMLTLPRVHSLAKAPAPRWRERLAAGRAHGAALLAAFFLTASAFLVVPFIGIFYTTHLGVQATELGLVYLAGGGGAALFMACLGGWVDRFGAPRCFFSVTSLSMVSILILTRLAQLVPADRGLWAAVPASLLFFCLMAGRMVPLNALLIERVPPAQRGSFMSLNVAAQSLAAAVGAVAGGFLSSLGGAVAGTFPTNGTVSVALSFIAMAVVLTLRRPSRFH